ETVSKVLGHKSLKITQIYARVLENKISEDMMVTKGKLEMLIIFILIPKLCVACLALATHSFKRFSIKKKQL
ncbi:hypothetical protein, partial [Carboxylicivirga taeanensis]|uniref:hypothetical protein n=1 Tax=Carboxylicivirga taeanensis TaxID=1416875 RepID=UPI003F6DCF56